MTRTPRLTRPIASLLVIASVMLGGGCGADSPLAELGRNDHLTLGLIGAGVGAGIGYAISGDATGALIGAGVGGLLGVGAGELVSQQRKQYKDDNAYLDAEIKNAEDALARLRQQQTDLASAVSELDARIKSQQAKAAAGQRDASAKSELVAQLDSVINGSNEEAVKIDKAIAYLEQAKVESTGADDTRIKALDQKIAELKQVKAKAEADLLALKAMKDTAAGL